MSSVSSPIIIALDFPDSQSALALASQLDPRKCRVKVGKELFSRAGPEVVEKLAAMKFEVFLDMKYHDIPNTVAGACRAAADLGCWMMNVHASGGSKMLEAAAEAISNLRSRPLLIAVTILTSLDNDDLREIGFAQDTREMTQRLAKLACEAGLDGVVSSAHDVVATKSSLGSDFLVVTPGIRPAGGTTGDQARIATPRNAVASGADYLVIGRPVTQANDPLAALDAIIGELQKT